jgi:hypothetical protein
MAVPATVDAQERMQLPDVRRLERMPSLPAWVALRIALLTIESQPDESGRRRPIPTLPCHLILKATEREEVGRHVGDLDALCRRTPADDPLAEQETLVLVTKMMLVLPSVTQNELSAEARGEAFMAALDDVPSWAVGSAIRRWYRGDCGHDPNGNPYDYHWCPAPADLRRVAWLEQYRVSSRADQLKKLLQAEPRIEFSSEHCRGMRERLDELFRGHANPPVGKDGSGGTTGDVPAEGAHCGTQPRHSPA